MTTDHTTLRALADAATRGPWIVAPSRDVQGAHTIPGVIPVLRARWADAEFIAAARDAVPALLDELERLRTSLWSVGVQRDAERDAKEGNVRALNAAVIERDAAREALAAEQCKTEATLRWIDNLGGLAATASDYRDLRAALEEGR
jgi:hypothetical protein